MNKIIAQAFVEELTKEAKLMPIVRLKGGLRRIFAKRKGAKNIYKQVSKETESMLKLDPNFDKKTFMKKRTAQLTREAEETTTARSKNILESGKGVKSQGWVSKHKKGLILGGAGAGALYLATAGGNTNNEEDESRRKLLASMRRGYYQ